MNERYKEVLNGCDCDLCAPSLEEAMIKIRDAKTHSQVPGGTTEYELRVGPAGLLFAGKVLDDNRLVNVGRTPFRIHVELVVDYGYAPEEWSLSACGFAFGSKGVR